MSRAFMSRENMSRGNMSRGNMSRGNMSSGNMVEREHGRVRTWSGGNNLHCGKDHIVGNLTLVQCVNNFPYTSSMEDF